MIEMRTSLMIRIMITNTRDRYLQSRQSFHNANYIDSNICHGISLKKPSGNVGTRTCVAGIRNQQKCYALDHHTSPKKDASSQELSNTLFPLVQC